MPFHPLLLFGDVACAENRDLRRRQERAKGVVWLADASNRFYSGGHRWRATGLASELLKRRGTHSAPVVVAVMSVVRR